MSSKSIVDISPTKKFFVDSITRDISVEKCIMDLIDNSIAGAKVNVPNSHLKMEGCVYGAIFKAVSARELQEACNYIGHCEVGDTVITQGYK